LVQPSTKQLEPAYQEWKALLEKQLDKDQSLIH
jgi:hypothetical protein